MTAGDQDPWRPRAEDHAKGQRAHPLRPTHGPPRRPASAGTALLLVMAILLAALALFPLAWEQAPSGCAALDAIVARKAGARGAAALPALEPGWPEFLRCHVAYWRWL